jgi:peroxiredoxin
LREIGYQIVAISADRPSMLQESLDKHDIGFQLLSDSSMTAAVEFGLAWRMPESMVKKYLTYDIDLDAASGQSHHVLPVPSVFVVGTDGVVRFQYVNPNHRVRLDASVLLAAARAQMARMSQAKSSE